MCVHKETLTKGEKNIKVYISFIYVYRAKNKDEPDRIRI